MSEMTENVALLALRIAKHSMSHDYAQAIETATTAIQAFPTCAAFYAQRGSLYTLVERDDLARKDYDRMVELSPTANRYLQRAGFFMIIGDEINAMQDCYEALRIQPSNRHAQNSLEIAMELMQLHR